MNLKNIDAIQKYFEYISMTQVSLLNLWHYNLKNFISKNLSPHTYNLNN